MQWQKIRQLSSVPHFFATLFSRYVPARDHAAVVQSQFEEEEKLGAMLQLDFAEAQARFGEQLAVASLGAIEKKNGTFRVVHDGTHGVGRASRYATN